MSPRIKVPANFGKEHINSPAHGNLLLKLKDGEEIRTNSMIMSLNSPVIDNLTTNLFQSSLEVDDFSKQAVDCFVEAMYTGEIDSLEKGIFEEVNKMAHVFEVKWLTKRCLKFFKTDLLNFENNSYEEILFTCEIASRSHYNLKQSMFMSCFVKIVAFNGISKSTFLHRYLAGFPDVPKRRIDAALAIATNDLNIIVSCLTCYLSFHLKCERLDEYSLYMLQKLDVQKLSRTFPSQFIEFTNFLSEIFERSDCGEVKAIVQNFVEVNSASVSSSSKEELEDDEIVEDLEVNDCSEDCKEVATQSEDIQPVWIKPVPKKYYTLILDEPVQIITTKNELRKDIDVLYTLLGKEGTVCKRGFTMRCENTAQSQWSYYIGGCTVEEHNEQFLNNVPPDEVKHWIITKTFSHLKIVCNDVTVLNFNFASDYSPFFENEHQAWLRRCTAVQCESYGYVDMLLLIKK